MFIIILISFICACSRKHRLYKSIVRCKDKNKFGKHKDFADKLKSFNIYKRISSHENRNCLLIWLIQGLSLMNPINCWSWSCLEQQLSHTT